MPSSNPFSSRRSRLQAIKQLKPKRQAELIQRKAAGAGTHVKCPGCSELLEPGELRLNLFTCPRCGHLFKMPADDRLASIIDNNAYEELDADLVGTNPLGFPGYAKKVDTARSKTGLNEAVKCVVGAIGGNRCVVAVLDSRFMMGSMGVAVGEKVTRAAELATARRLPLVIFSASGGARMQEGIFSLMQMAKTSAAIQKHDEAGLLYISVMTNPTTGGVTASFASLGDIILAEPEALIGFAGPRVIEQTIRQQLPEGFQSAEYLLEHGFVDRIVPRAELRDELAKLLSLHARSTDGGERDGR